MGSKHSCGWVCNNISAEHFCIWASASTFTLQLAGGHGDASRSFRLLSPQCCSQGPVVTAFCIPASRRHRPPPPLLLHPRRSLKTPSSLSFTVHHDCASRTGLSFFPMDDLSLHPSRWQQLRLGPEDDTDRPQPANPRPSFTGSNRAPLGQRPAVRPQVTHNHTTMRPRSAANGFDFGSGQPLPPPRRPLPNPFRVCAGSRIGIAPWG